MTWESTPGRELGRIRGRLTAARTDLAASRRKLANATHKGFRTRMLNEVSRLEREIQQLGERLVEIQGRDGAA